MLRPSRVPGPLLGLDILKQTRAGLSLKESLGWPWSPVVRAGPGAGLCPVRPLLQPAGRRQGLTHSSWVRRTPGRGSRGLVSSPVRRSTEQRGRIRTHGLPGPRDSQCPLLLPLFPPQCPASPSAVWPWCGMSPQCPASLSAVWPWCSSSRAPCHTVGVAPLLVPPAASEPHGGGALALTLRPVLLPGQLWAPPPVFPARRPLSAHCSDFQQLLH